LKKESEASLVELPINCLKNIGPVEMRYRIFSMLNEADFHCRVCGLRNEEPPWGNDGRTPLFDYCECCGVEHGYGDATPTGARRWREAWIAKGAQWFEPRAKPEGWSLQDQLANVPPEFK
jgi:hypothetical protein